VRVAYKGGFSAPELLNAPSADLSDAESPPPPPWPVQEGVDETGCQEMEAYRDEPWFRDPYARPAVPTPLPRIGVDPGAVGDRKGADRKTKKKTHTRRGVLAGAVAGGAAVAAARLLILDKPQVVSNFAGAVVDLSDHRGRLHNTVLDAPAAQTQVVTRVVTGPGGVGFPLISEPLKISQLLRRTAFGGTAALLQQANQQGFQKTVDQLLATAPAQPPPFAGGETLQAARNVNVNDLEDWWITHMVTTPTPFQERLTLFMAGLFTSDYQKVGLNTPFLIWQNRTWRDMALTDLRSILKRVSIDPAMLVYLDGNGSNGRGTPNQNYARELMELFSIGLVYSEQDVQQGAKALSGWRVPAAADNSMVGVFDPNRHFAGPVTFLGRTQPMDLDAVIDAILAHPNCAPFIAGKFVNEFVTATPDPAYVDRLATGFRNSGYQVKTLLRDLLASPEFAAQANFRGLVKSPLDFMVGAARLTGADPKVAVPVIRDYARQLGHEPFNPPNVSGWPSNASWLSPISLMNRVNFTTDFVNALSGVAAPADAAARYLDGILSPGTSQTLAHAQTDPARWWTLIASPDAQLA
jgi:uncharacterized protein (DUF1800 family)